MPLITVIQEVRVDSRDLYVVRRYGSASQKEPYRFLCKRNTKPDRECQIVSNPISRCRVLKHLRLSVRDLRLPCLAQVATFSHFILRSWMHLILLDDRGFLAEDRGLVTMPDLTPTFIRQPQSPKPLGYHLTACRQSAWIIWTQSITYSTHNATLTQTLLPLRPCF